MKMAERIEQQIRRAKDNALEKGRKSEKLEITKRLISMNIPDEQICEAAGVSLHLVNKIKKINEAIDTKKDTEPYEYFTYRDAWKSVPGYNPYPITFEEKLNMLDLTSHCDYIVDDIMKARIKAVKEAFDEIISKCDNIDKDALRKIGAYSLLPSDLTDEEICDVTGLTLDKLNTLKNAVKKH